MLKRRQPADVLVDGAPLGRDLAPSLPKCKSRKARSRMSTYGVDMGACRIGDLHLLAKQDVIETGIMQRRARANLLEIGGIR